MLRKKKWIIIAVVAAVVILAAGLIGVAANAQTANTSPAPGKTMIARVAAILGIDQAKVESAFKQAQKEMADEAMTNRIKSMVEKGVITQQQADQYKQWWQSKPDVPAPLMGPRMPMHRDGPGFPPIAPPAPSATGTAPQTK